MADSDEEEENFAKPESDEEREEGASVKKLRTIQRFKFPVETETFNSTDPNGRTYLNPERDQLMLIKLNATHLTFEQIDEYIVILENTMKAIEMDDA